MDQSGNQTSPGEGTVRAVLVRRGLALEWTTLAWNVVGLGVLGLSAAAARSVALAGFGLDSLIEIGAGTIVLWELGGAVDEQRQRRALRLIGWAFTGLAAVLLVQAVAVLATGFHAGHSRLGIAWTGLTGLVMFALAAAKARTGHALGNQVLQAEGRVTLVDGLLATAVLAGLAANAAVGWWWADPTAALVLVAYALVEGRVALRPAAEG